MYTCRIIFVIIEMFQPVSVPGIIGVILLAAGILLYAKTVIQHR